MSARIQTLSDECRAVNGAMLQRGLAPVNPPRITQSVAAWRVTALALLGVMPQNTEPTRGEMLQRAGEVSGKLYEIAGRDRGGREVSRFYGSTSRVWATFKQEPRLVYQITRDPENLGSLGTSRGTDGAVRGYFRYGVSGSFTPVRP